ncbi:cytochrome c-type biogenesis protein CcmH [Acidiferrimicrobium sp. IK]|uniref:cytochrome c-type biogenesis protein n=1 Tax=Acidiferrimicrobium sp. IK TaxID=2871700 RepID=UPI0021CB5996|nr:cytochrome c-type biogenesis protein CcmH [Acidiferrimicrobium sp. IK]MCU4185847.1 cytochrome c-type biogenesis protein CcmH [Acidiferrimicrobium sp. IK]
MSAGSLVRRWGIWAVIILAALGALVVGANRPSHPTLEQRTMSLASQVRCPVCGGESAAQSQVAAAVDIRTQIHQELAAGTPPRQVLDNIVRAYGTSILERPPARGIGLLVWIIPIGVVVVGAAGLALAFARWRRPAAAAAGRGGVMATGPGARPEDEALVARALGDGTAGAGDGTAGAGDGPGPGRAGPVGEGGE